MADEVGVEWPLTAAQIECLRGVWQLKSAKEIGAELHISHHAVEKRLLAARQQLGVSTSIAAARLIFEGTRDVTVGPYYEPSELQSEARPSEQGLAQGGVAPLPRATSGQARINNLGTIQTLLAIVLIAVGSIFALAALVAAAQGMNQLWKALGH